MTLHHSIPAGFRMAGVACGIKPSGKTDLTLIVSDGPAVAAGVYTKNLVQAANVRFNREKTPMANCRAVVVNSGNANACTGDRGERDTRRMAELAAAACGADAGQVLVMSTGIIGVFLPMDRIESGVAAAAQQLDDSPAALDSAIAGLMTTDKFPKLASRTCPLSSGSAKIIGLAKGAGMIGPNMATLLSVILTDAALTPADAQEILQRAVDESFNCISVEGHTSTSDTVLLLANGAASPEPLQGEQKEHFADAVRDVCIDLARMIPDDGEGASHLITIDVRGCRSRRDARHIARAVAESALVKTAIAGADPNWGRIISAAGYAGVPFDPQQLSLSINGTLVFQNGTPTDFDEATVSASIKADRNVSLELAFAEGDAEIRFWASDLTVDYVIFNSEYTT